MSVNLKSNAVFKFSKIYLLKFKNKTIINETLNKLYNQRKMRFTIQSTIFSYFIFVVWQDTSDDRKDRAVINIRDFNDITKIDNYLFSLQFDIIVSITRYSYISIVNAIDWFYQFNIRRSNRFKFTMISHRD